MSRSRRKTTIISFLVWRGESLAKRGYNRRYRQICKQRLKANLDFEFLPHFRELNKPWRMNKNGKKWFDAKGLPELMRK